MVARGLPTKHDAGKGSGTAIHSGVMEHCSKVSSSARWREGKAADGAKDESNHTHEKLR